MTSTRNQRGIGSGLQETVEIPANAEAPSAARAFLRDHLRDDFEPGRLHDLDLIVTELVTNAVQHGSNPGDGITLDLRRRRSTIHVGVTDRCRKRTSPALLASSSDRESGRGLMTVERFAELTGATETRPNVFWWIRFRSPYWHLELEERNGTPYDLRQRSHGQADR